MHSLSEPINPTEEEEMTIGDMLAAEVEDPSATASREIDRQEFYDRLSDRERVVLRGLSEGHGTNELAKSLNVSASRITQMKRNIGQEIHERWGENVLDQVGKEPQWRSSLMAKERCGV